MIDITREQFFEFIKTAKDTPDALTSATQHYLAYFDKYQSAGKKGSWNWGGISPIWFFYRRMYNYGAGYILITRLLDKVSVKIFQNFAIGEDLGGGISLGVGVLLWIGSMRYADYLYLYYASEKISKGKKTSGVNKWAAIALGVISLIALSFLLFIFLRDTNNPI